MRLLIFAFLLIVYMGAHAQKLPNVQQVSLRAPANVKIDGKATEWDGKFEAYNKNTQIYYTISNNADNLYLTVQVTDLTIIKKVLAAGITFTINQANKQKDSTTTAFSYPFYSRDQKLITIDDQLISGAKPGDSFQFDSLAKAYNTQITTVFKLIGTIGLKGINDNFVSIYNEEGIKAASCFNKDLLYSYELAIPLKLLGYKANGSTKFNYNIQTNGQKTFNGYVIVPAPGRSTLLTFEDDNGKRFMLDQNFKDIYYATDFWGEYTLAE